MSKNTNFRGEPIYSQLLKFINKDQVEQLSKNKGHERYVKKHDGYTLLVSMLFAVMHRYDSLREITLGMLSESHKLYHLGIDYYVKHSTLSEANSRRDSSFFEQVYAKLYKQHKESLVDSNSQKSGLSDFAFQIRLLSDCLPEY